jgi:hypothetical protein
MTEFLEILKYVLPSLVVFLTAAWIMQAFLKREDSRRKLEVSLKNYKTITPIRLQAYERIVLFLERVSPESLILRVTRQGMTAKQLQSEMINSIRAEFEHNLSQQVYISNEAWELVKSARSNLIKMINTCAENVNPEAPAFNLSKAILEAVMEMDKQPSNQAIDFLKKEMQTYF